MDPLTLALIATGVAKAGAGIAQGVGTARAAKGMMLTPEQEEELAAIERGDGLSDRRRGALEARFLQQQAGAQRQLEAAGLQQAAARGLSGGVSGRDVFLQEVAEAESARQIRQQQNVVLEQARAEGLAKADAMRLQQQQAEAQRRAGITQAVSLGLTGAADVASTAIAGQQQLAMAEAQAGLQDTDALLNQLEDTAATQGFSLMQGI
jgi:hypothetical protein